MIGAGGDIAGGVVSQLGNAVDGIGGHAQAIERIVTVLRRMAIGVDRETVTVPPRSRIRSRVYSRVYVCNGHGISRIGVR